MNIPETELSICLPQSYSLIYSSVGMKPCTHHPKEKYFNSFPFIRTPNRQDLSLVT